MKSILFSDVAGKGDKILSFVKAAEDAKYGFWEGECLK